MQYKVISRCVLLKGRASNSFPRLLRTYSILTRSSLRLISESGVRLLKPRKPEESGEKVVAMFKADDFQNLTIHDEILIVPEG